MNKNETVKVYKNFKNLIEDSLLEGVSEDEFAIVFKQEVLFYIEGTSNNYQVINKFIERMIRLYSQVITKISLLKMNNITSGYIGYNNGLKKVFLHFMANKNIAQAIDMLYAKHPVDQNNDDELMNKIEKLLNSSFAKNNLEIFIKEDIKEFLNEKLFDYNTNNNSKFIENLAKYITNEIYIVVNDENNKFNIGRFDLENEILMKKIIELQKEYLEVELKKCMISNGSLEEFWNDY